MDNFLDLLNQHIELVDTIGNKIEAGDPYMDDMRAYVPSLSQMITTIGQLAEEGALQLSQEFVAQVLNDILYGMEQEDSVFLLDVLRYGLLEIYDYLRAELQKEVSNE